MTYGCILQKPFGEVGGEQRRLLIGVPVPARRQILKRCLKDGRPGRCSFAGRVPFERVIPAKAGIQTPFPAPFRMGAHKDIHFAGITGSRIMKLYNTITLLTCLTILSPALLRAGETGATPAEGTFGGALRETMASFREHMPVTIHGFGEGAFGWLPEKNRRLRNHRVNLMEGRLQLKSRYYPESPALLYDWATAFSGRVDLVGDGVREEGRVEVRELTMRITPLRWLDLLAGRQVLTWGTGDLLFLNDLFPKDWVSFFTGRDLEYLKRPSDAVRLSAFSTWCNADFVLIPFFQPDNSPRGNALSFYDQLSGTIVGEESRLHFNEPPRTPGHMEYAARLYRSAGSYEVAFYGFKGFYKQPRGVMNPFTGDLFYPRLVSTGTSLRGPVPRLGGIGNLECAWCHSEHDRDGDDPFIENSQVRYLAGYERSLRRDVMVGVQYYVEEMLEWDEYRRSMRGGGGGEENEFRQVVTLRVTKKFPRKNAEAGVFGMYSPTDRDFYIRPHLSWDVTDRWNLTVGANVLAGARSHTLLGQFRDNNNVYARLRYNF